MALTFNGKEINTVNFNGKEVNTVYLNRNVGYDIVGNPTIVDGVASGFYYSYQSPDNAYIRINQFVSNPTSIEFVTKVKFNSFPRWQAIFSGTVEQGGFLLRSKFDEGSLSFSPYFTYSSNNFILTSNTPISTNTYYWIKISKNGNQYNMLISNNGNTFTEIASATSDLEIGGSFVLYGVAGVYSDTGLDGSIDLNETYIKVNGVTWFNGEQTVTTPVWTRSV